MHISGAQPKKASARQNSGKKDELFRMECSTLPLAGRGETHTMKEWKRIYGYEQGYMFAGKFIKVEASPAPEPVSHTPGPWKAFDNAGSTMQGYSQSSGVIGTGEHSGKIICGCFHDIGGEDVAAANARLVAAAPALLKAAKKAMEGYVDLIETEEGKALQSAIDQAEEARWP